MTTHVGRCRPDVLGEACNTLARDRGSIRETIVFDTLGDPTPGGEFIESVSIRANGPHPGWEFDACDYFG